MTEDTKELVKALVGGFSNSVNKLSEKFATKNEIKQVMQEQTDRVLEVLNKYESMTERHDRLLKGLKDTFDKEK